MSAVRTIEFAQYDVTNVHPAAGAFMAFATVLALRSKRSSVILGALLVCLLMPIEQRLVVAGLDFSMLRLFMLVAWIRVFVRGEYRGFRFGRLDWLIVFWVASASLFHVLRVGSGGIVFRLGASFDVITAYFLIRVLVRTSGELFIMWRHMAWIVVGLAPLLFYEAVARYNVFGVFDYAGFDLVLVRNGTVRAQGPFAHPILAGTFGAVTTPIFVGLFFGRKKGRSLYAAAAIGATIIIVTAGSSGPIVAWGVGVLGWAIWAFRAHTRKMIWASVLMGVVIHFAREKPIWHLIGRMSSLTSGTGWHRYRLIDAFISRFGEWALTGTGNTAHWGWGLQDITNQYVAEGVTGGFVTLCLFVAILSTSFMRLRRARLFYERIKGAKSPWALLAWGTSVSLAANCVSFISVSYFGQMYSFFVFFIATVSPLAKFRRPKATKVPATSRSPKAPRPRAATKVRAIHPPG